MRGNIFASFLQLFYNHLIFTNNSHYVRCVDAPFAEGEPFFVEVFEGGADVVDCIKNQTRQLDESEVAGNKHCKDNALFINFQIICHIFDKIITNY